VGGSIDNNIARLIQAQRAQQDSGLKNAIVFVDISKAYDSVDRTGLMMNLRMMAHAMNGAYENWI